ncbi:MAG: VanW family protein [Defluviitaleaceae bacterium]|nr:VanW family protein [Defluviitaleaceae bacterium]
MTVGKKLLLIICLVACAVSALVLLLAGSAPDADRIYTHIYIHGVPVGGLTAAEAEAALMTRFQPVLDGQTVHYTLDGHTVAVFSFADFGATFDFAPAVQAALEYSAFGSFPSRIRRLLGRGYKIESPVVLTISPYRMESILTGLSRQINRSAQNATFGQQDGDMVVTPESPGFSMDMQEAAQATGQVLNSMTSGTVALLVQKITPAYTAADFTFDISALGSFETKYAGANDDGRIFNLRLAAEKIHNQVLYPGQVFSAGATIGAHRPDSGYKAAIVLVDGEPVEDIGGGVCQVVSTLYNAALKAELPIVQRHNHSAPVSYVESGFDATVAGDYYDLKFENNTPHPILITSHMANGNLRIIVHGKESRPAGRTIRFEAKHMETIAAESYREVLDAAIPLGQRHIVLDPQHGLRIELHKHVYIDGTLVETVKINTSTYKPLQGVIAIGAG